MCLLQYHCLPHKGFLNAWWKEFCYLDVFHVILLHIEIVLECNDPFKGILPKAITSGIWIVTIYRSSHFFHVIKAALVLLRWDQFNAGYLCFVTSSHYFQHHFMYPFWFHNILVEWHLSWPVSRVMFDVWWDLQGASILIHGMLNELNKNLESELMLW